MNIQTVSSVKMLIWSYGGAISQRQQSTLVAIKRDPKAERTVDTLQLVSQSLKGIAPPFPASAGSQLEAQDAQGKCG